MPKPAAVNSLETWYIIVPKTMWIGTVKLALFNTNRKWFYNFNKDNTVILHAYFQSNFNFIISSQLFCKENSGDAQIRDDTKGSWDP